VAGSKLGWSELGRHHQSQEREDKGVQGMHLDNQNVRFREDGNVKENRGALLGPFLL
jgi:hypothetical protein